ncbi:MAG: bifunctional protein-serine/threonine kinase/phosphatase [Alphaproteobacteria bacterium]|nr:bifunctional protein-serine/threonine kinase/phosphatase [Alphaproteobacteria bacterium]
MPVQISIGAYSNAGIKPRNEDSYGAMFPEENQSVTKGVAIAIADGMSTCPNAKEASETCIKCFLLDYFSTPNSWGVKKSVGKILNATNSWMYSQSQHAQSVEHGMVSTLSAMVIKSGKAHIFHVGDSRISLIRDGNIEPLTQDHILKDFTGHSFLNRAMGTGVHLDMDYKTVPLHQDDILIFTTDGVHEHINPNNIKNLTLKGPDNLDITAKAIVDVALEAGSKDNVTCQIVKIDNLANEYTPTALSGGNLPFPPLLENGQILDGYKIIRELHANNRSQVYLAQQQGSDQYVAIKTPSINFEDDPIYINAFKREEWIGAQISEPHIVKYLPAAADKQFLYMVTEYIEGQTLREWIDNHPNPDLSEVKEIVLQIITAIRSLHRQDMVHRDLKPDNVMIDRAGMIRLIDLGSVHVASLDEEDDSQDDTQLLGSVDYTAPEYLLHGKASRATDLYSLGVILYEMLTHKLPYGRGFKNSYDVKRLKYISALSVNEELPAWVELILQKATAIDIDERYERFSELQHDLTKPKHEIYTKAKESLLQRNPVGFWKTTTAILAAIIVLLLVLGE